MQRAPQAESPHPDLCYVSENDESMAFVLDCERTHDDPSGPSWRGSAVAMHFPPHGILPSRNERKQASPLARVAVPLCDIAGIVAASRLERPPAPRVPFGVAQVDELTGGLPRGGLTEICGELSSGRTSLMLSAMAQATSRGEMCALVDATDCFDPHSAATSGVNLDRLLWARCAAKDETIPNTHESLAAADVAAVCSTLRHKQAVGSVMPHAKVWYGRSPARSERGSSSPHDSNQTHLAARRSNTVDSLAKRKAAPGTKGGGDPTLRAGKRGYWARCIDRSLRVADLLLQSGGFGLVVIDLGDVPHESSRRIPLTSWFRFRRAVENTPAVLLTLVRQSCAKTCASLVLNMEGNRRAGAPTPSNVNLTPQSNQQTAEAPAHARVFTGLDITIEVTRAAEPQKDVRKPPRPARATFESHPGWITIYDRSIG